MMWRDLSSSWDSEPIEAAVRALIDNIDRTKITLFFFKTERSGLTIDLHRGGRTAIERGGLAEQKLDPARASTGAAHVRWGEDKPRDRLRSTLKVAKAARLKGEMDEAGDLRVIDRVLKFSTEAPCDARETDPNVEFEGLRAEPLSLVETDDAVDAEPAQLNLIITRPAPLRPLLNLNAPHRRAPSSGGGVGVKRSERRSR